MAVLSRADPHPIEAAKVDGCNAWQVFRHISLPFVMPFIYIAPSGYLGLRQRHSRHRLTSGCGLTA